ncbi:MAG: hypothetical protein K0U98_14485 [Deltaproteobacteria bacterium]|nr:hypothetical protein [Deltaproteobacteria bacterium]
MTKFRLKRLTINLDHRASSREENGDQVPTCPLSSNCITPTPRMNREERDEAVAVLEEALGNLRHQEELEDRVR